METLKEYFFGRFPKSIKPDEGNNHMRIIFRFVLFGCLCVAGCGRQSETSNLSTSSEQQQLVDSINTFSIDFYKRMIAEKPYDTMNNVMVSPLGVPVLLGMLYQGATPEVAAEIETRLNWATLKERVHPAFHDVLKRIKNQPEVQLYLAGQLWFDERYRLDQTYTETMGKYYGTVPESLDLVKDADAVGKRFAGWITKQTHGEIKTDALDLRAVDVNSLLLASVIYFNGNWEYRFDPSATKDWDFFTGKTLADKTSVKVKMMYQKGKFKYLYAKDYQLLEMPYKGNSVSMIIFLPTTRIYDHFEKNLNWAELQKGIDELEITNSLRVLIPKFEFRNKAPMVQPLISMGLKKTFTVPGGFAGMTTPLNAFRTEDLCQQTYIKVNEEGTKAYAVTTTRWPWLSKPREPEFFANHPFIFMIRDLKSGLILFIGKVSNPNLLQS